LGDGVRLHPVAGLGRNQMRDLGRAFGVETLHGILKHAIGVGDALVLAQMFKP
jgi:hypothetical protein